MASHGVPRVSGAATGDKSEQAIAKERKQIDAYKQLESDVKTKIKATDYSNDTLQQTSKLLTQNPEYYTIWNYRRLILQDVFARELTANSTTESTPENTDTQAAQKAGLTLPQQEISLLIKEDLQFLIPLLKQFPKCYWIWNHRAWLLSTATSHLPTHNTVQLWQGELGLVSKMLALDSRNFHGWGYRRQVVYEIEKLGGQSMVEMEFEYTSKMIRTNLSNFSAWHYRSQLIPRLLVERNAGSEERREMLDAEFELITRALYTDPYDQSLWFYHQYLMSTLDERNWQSVAILEPCTNGDRVRYLEQELENVKEMLDGAEDCKYIYQALLEYSQRYLEVEAGNKKATTLEMKGWLDELRKIDPLREGRWIDLEKSLLLWVVTRVLSYSIERYIKSIVERTYQYSIQGDGFTSRLKRKIKSTKRQLQNQVTQFKKIISSSSQTENQVADDVIRAKSNRVFYSIQGFVVEHFRGVEFDFASFPQMLKPYVRQFAPTIDRPPVDFWLNIINSLIALRILTTFHAAEWMFGHAAEGPILAAIQLAKTVEGTPDPKWLAMTRKLLNSNAPQELQNADRQFVENLINLVYFDLSPCLHIDWTNEVRDQLVNIFTRTQEFFRTVYSQQSRFEVVLPTAVVDGERQSFLADKMELVNSDGSNEDALTGQPIEISVFPAVYKRGDGPDDDVITVVAKAKVVPRL